MSPKKLIIIDFDKVEESNLDRQILYDRFDIGNFKSEIAHQKLVQFCNIDAHNIKLDKTNIFDLNLEESDLIIDCTDNNQVRFAINEFCKSKNIHWIHSAVIEKIGTVFFIEDNYDDFDKLNQNKAGKKAKEVGVSNSAVSFVASIVTNIAVDYLIYNKYPQDLIRINLDSLEIIKLKIN
jgi:molybdopterin/thiamine biosynthesis adenylyltransferase